jgi:hypothetical protein
MQDFFKAGGAPPLGLVFNGGVVFHYPFFFNGRGCHSKTRYFYPIFAKFCDKRWRLLAVTNLIPIHFLFCNKEKEWLISISLNFNPDIKADK